MFNFDLDQDRVLMSVLNWIRKDPFVCSKPALIQGICLGLYCCVKPSTHSSFRSSALQFAIYRATYGTAKYTGYVNISDMERDYIIYDVTSFFQI